MIWLFIFIAIANAFCAGLMLGMGKKFAYYFNFFATCINVINIAMYM